MQQVFIHQLQGQRFIARLQRMDDGAVLFMRVLRRAC